jgi:hypothetical protein
MVFESWKVLHLIVGHVAAFQITMLNYLPIVPITEAWISSD